ncbi:MAG: aldo/keto reductase [candidate division Zixibacteria bacterium]|nr:aldo/keto reductase [candidate division Zixibacteria bacterium]
MDYRFMGKTGLNVSSICLGTAFRGQVDEHVCIRVIDRAIGGGCTFIDTALYGSGRSETILGRALKGKRENIVLCTKIYGTLGDAPHHTGLTRVNLMRGVEASLKRLQTDYIDVYLLHAFDPNAPVEEVVRTLDDIVHQGKVRYIGCSNWPAYKIMEALWVSDRRNLAPFFCLQNQYSLLNRWEFEPELMPICRQHGLGMMAYSPLGLGLLTGRFRREVAPPEDSPWGSDPAPGLSRSKYPFEQAMTEQADNIIQTLIDMGAKYEKTPAQMAIAWVLDHPEVTAPILGADLPEHVDEALGAVGWTLEREDRALLDELSTPRMPLKFS